MNLKIILPFLLFTLSLTSQTTAQSSSDQSLIQKVDSIEKKLGFLDKLRLSGYVQPQFQWGGKDADLSVGKDNERDESFNRIGIRRGRIKLTYTENYVSGVLQLDFTENGVDLKDIYLNIKDPWINWFQLRGGVFDRPFGYEISYSSRRRESPERSTIFRTLFPNERDMGMMLTIQPPATSPFHIVRLQAGLFAGNGINRENDNRRDFIGHLSLSKEINKDFHLGLGVSHYNGFVSNDLSYYDMTGSTIIYHTNEDQKNKYNRRIYYGFDARVRLETLFGRTQLKGEYLFGQQPGLSHSSESPTDWSIYGPRYIRSFRGGYVMFVQSLGNLPLSTVVKYDWYDPNTRVVRDDIGATEQTGSVDLARYTWGLGMVWSINKNLRLQAYYDINRNETTHNLESREWETDKDDDVFTLRLQCMF